MIWFTADTHFGHANIIRYCDRPFESKYDHDETLIKNWNAVVQKDDHVYHLGDFGFGSPKWLMDKVACRLRGRIHLIRGNHDRGVIKEPLVRRFEFVKDVHMGKVQHKGHGIQIFLSHYAHRSWPQANYGVIHLFGHSHGRMPALGRSFDVGVDCWGYTPISMETVLEKIKELDPEQVS
jgi:calcineurin-like phosphoesterase family protein